MLRSRATLRSVEFRREREKGWRKLESLIVKVERDGVASLQEKELAMLPKLHRSALSALSVARAVSLDRNLLEYLEALTQRSYFAVYGQQRGLGATFADFFKGGFPAAVRRAWAPILVAIGILLLGTITGYALTLDDPDRYYSFVDEQLAGGRDPSASDELLRDALYSDENLAEGLAAFAAMLFTHNTRIGFLCFALGFAAGVPVMYCCSSPV